MVGASASDLGHRRAHPDIVHLTRNHAITPRGGRSAALLCAGVLHSCDPRPDSTWVMFTLTSALPAAAAAIVATAAIAACGSSSSSSSSASSFSGQVSDAHALRDAVSFAGCMRSHGVPGFQDPTSFGQFKHEFNSSVRSPALQSAAAACQHLLPGGGPHQSAAPSQAKIAAGRAFARCMRSHGFPSFPDPTSSGVLSAPGINIHQPAFLQTAEACVGTTHGFLTRADVARYVAGQ